MALIMVWPFYLFAYLSGKTGFVQYIPIYNILLKNVNKGHRKLVVAMVIEEQVNILTKTSASSLAYLGITVALRKVQLYQNFPEIFHIAQRPRQQ